MTVIAEENKDVKKNYKTFKKCADVENFYRFISDNSLRTEAKLVLETIVKLLKKKKNSGRKRRTRQ